IWALLYLFIKLPVMMILLGGFSTPILLLIVVFAAWHFRYRRTPGSLLPSRLYDTALGLSGLSILAIGVYSIIKIVCVHQRIPGAVSICPLNAVIFSLLCPQNGVIIP